MSEKVFGCACEGTGIDPTFQDACKCTQEEKVTDKQAKFLADLIMAITAIMKVELGWANVSTKAEGSKVIDLLKSIKTLVFILKTKKGQITNEQIETIRTKINAKPQIGWVNQQIKELATKPVDASAIAIWRQAKINGLVKELGDKLSDEQKATIKAKMASEGDAWADQAINKLLKIKSS